MPFVSSLLRSIFAHFWSQFHHWLSTTTAVTEKLQLKSFKIHQIQPLSAAKIVFESSCHNMSRLVQTFAFHSIPLYSFTKAHLRSFHQLNFRYMNPKLEEQFQSISFYFIFIIFINFHRFSKTCTHVVAHIRTFHFIRLNNNNLRACKANLSKFICISHN